MDEDFEWKIGSEEGEFIKGLEKGGLEGDSKKGRGREAEQG